MMSTWSCARCGRASRPPPIRPPTTNVMMNLPPEVEAALLGKQVVFMRGVLDEAAANAILAQLLLMSRTATGRTIQLYVDSPGGTLGAALGVYDMMQSLGTVVSTTCVGTAGGASALVLAGGAVRQA